MKLLQTSTVLFIGLLSSAAMASSAVHSEKEAKAIALKEYAGKVKEVEKESFKGEGVYSVEIDGKDGLRELKIRLTDGKILSNEIDDESDDEHED